MIRFSLLSLVVFASACNGPGSIHLTYGDPIAVKSAVFIPELDSNGNFAAAIVMLSDQPDLCRSLRGGRMPKKMSGVELEVLRIGDSSYLAPDVGDYTVITAKPDRPGGYAVGEFMRNDLNCKNTLTASDALMRSGLVTIDDIQTGHDGLVSGTFDVTYGQGDSAQGRFTAEYCELTTSHLNCQ